MKALATGATSIVARAPFVAEFSTALIPYRAVGEGEFPAFSRGPIHGDGDLVRHIVVHMPTPLPFSKDIDFDDEHVCFGRQSGHP